MIGSFFGFVSVFIASSNNVAWTLLILICSIVNITLTLLAHILETKISNRIKYGLLFVAIQIASIFFISKYMSPGPTSYGIDIFFKKHINLIYDKNVGVLAIKSSVNKDGKHIVDLLKKEKNTNLIKIFSPEHGFYSDASNGEIVADSSYLDIEIVSLYGKNRKPSEQDVKNLDVLIIDIQDIGSTYYTYLSTVTYMLEAAAEHDISVIILDRPNPLDMLVYGPIREKLGFIGMHPIPIRHGMTIGELSIMINEEGWLNNNLKVKDLKIIKMKKIPKKNQFYKWLPTSPNIPDKETAFIYNGMCLFEGTNISEGRGTTYPFKTIGAPWVDSSDLISYIEHLKETKYGNKVIVKESEFIPIANKGAKNPKYENQICYGIFIEYLDQSIEPIDLAIDLLSYFSRYDSFSFKDSFFDTLYGNSDLRLSISNIDSLSKIVTTIKKDVIKFKEFRKDYLIYKQKHKQ